jgi:predicted RNase H-like nuclease (RuvC/YqgF family)
MTQAAEPLMQDPMQNNDQETPTARIRERLAELLAEWGAEFSSVLEDLETTRRTVAERDARIAELMAELDGRERDAAEIEQLREQQAARDTEIAERDAELADLREQLQKQRAALDQLAGKLAAAEQARQEDQHKEAELARLKRQKKQADDHVNELLEQVRLLREAADEEASGGATEIAALQAELDARKTLVRSLRADAERAKALETLLDEKKTIIETLEASINRNADTITELKRSAEYWKTKYRSAYGDFGATTTITRSAMPMAGAGAPAERAGLSAVSPSDSGQEDAARHDQAAEPSVAGDEDPADADARQIAALLEAAGKAGADSDDGEDMADRTIAIDMRHALVEARRAAGQFNRKS